MRIVLICTNVMNGSVGKISRDLYDNIIKNGDDCLLCYGRGNSPIGYNSYKIDTLFNIYFHAFLSRLFDSDGKHSLIATIKLIKKLEQYKPDIVHLHCLHGYYINYKILFHYLKKKKIKIVWTMHDCWAYTGHCAFYTYVQCDKWKYGCSNCKQKSSYPKSILLDRSKNNYILKNKIYTSINKNNIIVVSPSMWLKGELKKSFLNKYRIAVINNCVDNNVFYLDPTVKRVNRILGVANKWDKRKGLNDFIQLQKILPPDFEILIVGADTNQIKMLKLYNIKAIPRTNNIQELKYLYQSSLVLFNPTYEDNYPTVNIEAISCGLPVVTYDTGGSPEAILETNMGLVIRRKEYKKILSYLMQIKMKFPIATKQLNNSMVDEYYHLYQELVERKE